MTIRTVRKSYAPHAGQDTDLQMRATRKNCLHQIPAASKSHSQSMRADGVGMSQEPDLRPLFASLTDRLSAGTALGAGFLTLMAGEVAFAQTAPAGPTQLPTVAVEGKPVLPNPDY